MYYFANQKSSKKGKEKKLINLQYVHTLTETKRNNTIQYNTSQLSNRHLSTFFFFFPPPITLPANERDKKTNKLCEKE